MTLPPRTLAQLSTTAHAADRANRPTHLIAVGAITLFASVAFALFSFRSLSDARSALSRAHIQTQKNDQLIDRYKSSQREEVSLASFYPHSPYIDTAIATVIDPYKDEFDRTPDVAPNPDRRDVQGVPGLEQYELRCTARNDPLELSMRWMTDALNDEPHCKDRVFVSQVSLSPLPTNNHWNTTFKLAWYVAK